MQLKLDNPRMFSEVISIISELVAEVKIKISKEGMNIVAVDPANVAMVIFNLPVSAFSQIEAENETIGVNLENLKAMLKRCSAGSALIMKTEDNFLKIEIIDRIKREFTLTLLDIESKDKPVPQLDFSAHIEMAGIDFAEAVEDCMIVSDSCAFEAKTDRFCISAKGPLNSANLLYTSDEVKIESPLQVKSRYSLEYLQKMMKATRIGDKAGIYFSADYPLKLEFKTPLIELAFILAPRIETEN